MDVNGTYTLSVSRKEDIRRLKVLSIDEKEAVVFYAGEGFIGYAILKKENRKWTVKRTNSFDTAEELVELVTKEAYQSFIKNLLSKQVK